MASRFWVGGTASWTASNTANWSATSGGAGGASVPTASDTVTFDANSNATAYTVTITAAAHCSDLTIGQPTAGNLTFAGSSTLEVAGNFSIATGVVRSYVGNITFSATATGKTLTFNGITMASFMNFNGSGGGWTLQDALNNSSAEIQLTTGTLDTNGKTVTLGLLEFGGSTTRTLTLGASTINCTNLQATVTTNLTFNANTSTIAMTTAGTGIITTALTFNNVTFNLTGSNGIAAGSITGTCTFANLTITNSVLQTGFVFFSNQTITGTLTITGSDAASGRIILTSDTYGTTRTLTAAIVSLTNVDFEDMTAAGAAIPFTGSVLGDLGNNTNITFTTPVTRFWVGNGGSFSSTTHWSTSTGGASGASVPLPQDTVNFDSNSISSGSQTITCDCIPLGKDVTFTGVTNTPSVSFTPVGGCWVTGSLTLVAGMSITAGTGQLEFKGSSSSTFTSAGLTIDRPIRIVKGGGGTVTLQDALSMASSRTLFLIVGTFDANDFNLTIDSFNSSLSSVRTLSMGNGTWSITGTGTIWTTATTTNLTLNSESSTIDCTNSSATSRTVTAGSVVLNHAKVSAGTGSVTFTNVNANNLDFTGFTGTLAAASSDIGIRGNLTLGSGMTLGSSGLNDFIFTATSGTHTITSNAVAIARNITLNGVGGTWQLADAITLSSPRTITLTNGTFDANDFNLTLGGFLSSNANVRTLLMGTATWLFPGTGTVWTGGTGTNFTLNAETSTIKITDTSASSKTFFPASTGTQTFYIIQVDGDNAILDSGFTLNTLFLNHPGAVTGTSLQNSNTYTLTTLTAQGTAGNLIILKSSSGSLVATLSKAGFNTDCDYMSVTRIVGTGGARWFVGEHSTDGGGNKGLRFAQSSNRQHAGSNNVASI